MNEKGMTLIELLCALALFTIVTTVCLSLFQDYATMSNRTTEQVSAVGIVEQVAHYVHTSPESASQVMTNWTCSESTLEKDIISSFYLVSEAEQFYLNESNQVYYRSVNNDRYYPSIVQHCATERENTLGLVPLVIELYRLDREGSRHKVAETFRYIDVEKAS